MSERTVKLRGLSLVRVYFAGPIGEEPEINYPKFHAVEVAWNRAFPRDVTENPARNFGGDMSLPRPCYMEAGLRQLLSCQIVCLLPGWWRSEGARWEAKSALMMNKIFYVAYQVGEGWRFYELNNATISGVLNEPAVPGAEQVMLANGGLVRTFETGAKRDADEGKLNYEAYLSPLVLRRFAEYMQSHTTMKDGSTREGDDWQQGMPLKSYMESMWRHFMDVWTAYRKWDTGAPEMDEALCALLFNVMGYLHEYMKQTYGFTNQDEAES